MPQYSATFPFYFIIITALSNAFASAKCLFLVHCHVWVACVLTLPRPQSPLASGHCPLHPVACSSSSSCVSDASMPAQIAGCLPKLPHACLLLACMNYELTLHVLAHINTEGAMLPFWIHCNLLYLYSGISQSNGACLFGAISLRI